MPVLKNPKHEAFAQGLARGKTADQAYVDAGYKPHRPSASRLRANANISQRVAELTERAAVRTEITIARVLQELARIGMADASRALDADGRLLPLHEMDEDTRRAISSIEVETVRSRNRDGSVDEEVRLHKVKFWDKNSALEKIAKHFGMFIERHEIGRPGEFDSLNDHELDEYIASRTGTVGGGSTRARIEGGAQSAAGPRRAH